MANTLPNLHSEPGLWHNYPCSQGRIYRRKYQEAGFISPHVRFGVVEHQMNVVTMERGMRVAQSRRMLRSVGRFLVGQSSVVW